MDEVGKLGTYCGKNATERGDVRGFALGAPEHVCLITVRPQQKRVTTTLKQQQQWNPRQLTFGLLNVAMTKHGRAIVERVATEYATQAQREFEACESADGQDLSLNQITTAAVWLSILAHLVDNKPSPPQADDALLAIQRERDDALPTTPAYLDQLPELRRAALAERLATEGESSLYVLELVRTEPVIAACVAEVKRTVEYGFSCSNPDYFGKRWGSIGPALVPTLHELIDRDWDHEPQYQLLIHAMMHAADNGDDAIQQLLQHRKEPVRAAARSIVDERLAAKPSSTDL